VEEPQGARRTRWNVGIALLVLAIVVLIVVLMVGGGGPEENETASLALRA
jgi:hypothetical protein